MAKKQHYMTKEERCKLEAYREAGKGVSWIARQLGFSRQTIYNELKRGQCEQVKRRNGYYRDEIHYSAYKAQQIHDYNQTAKGRPLKIGNDHAFAQFLEDRMIGRQEDGHIDKRKRYSPAAALDLARREGYHTSICVSTLYSYIDKGVFLTMTNRYLWEKSKRKPRKEKTEKRTAHPLLPSIADRAEEVNQRLRPGDWEMDLVIGKATTSACLLALYERRNQKYLLFKLPDRKAATIRGVFDRLEARYPDFKERFRTITTDNGSEFMEYEKLRQSIYGGTRFQVYYCHPYAAWEKGGIENHNRWVRRWYPKGTDFTKVSKKQLLEFQNWINNYPRKSLGWKTPNEAAA